MPPKPAVFLDRDGVLIEEIGYLSEPSQVRLIPGAGAAVARLNRLGVPVVVVTNQAGVARGKFPEENVRAVHEHLDKLLAAGGARIDRWYYCPHHPTAGVGPYRVLCACRKPAAGMLLTAARELNLDLAGSVLIGDKLSDLEAGAAAGCSTILVRTGYGAEHQKSAPPGRFNLRYVADDLPAGIDLCLPLLGGSLLKKGA
jgi:D-glycero-D-manno-heptose 1,7-bisphosphate phosphatase